MMIMHDAKNKNIAERNYRQNRAVACFAYEALSSSAAYEMSCMPHGFDYLLQSEVIKGTGEKLSKRIQYPRCHPRISCLRTLRLRCLTYVV